jgi:hypothetical protein
MTDHKGVDAGASLSVGPDHVRAQVSEGALSKIGAGIKWLFPKRDAKVKITSALAMRVSEKFTRGEQLDEQERAFMSLMLDKQARALANREAVVERVYEVLPEVNAQILQQPSPPDYATSGTFITRAESIASEITEEDLQDLFARVLAGELSRPGSFSLRTLETVRVLDQGLASTFEIARRFAFNNEVILLEGEIGTLVVKRGLDWNSFLDLQDAGLVDPGFSQLPMTFGNKDEEIIWGYQDRILRMNLRSSGVICSRPTPAKRLTRTGRELASVLPIVADEEYFAKCRAWLSLILGRSGAVDWKYINEGNWRPE